MTVFPSRDEIHEAGQRLVRLVPHVAKLHHHLLLQLVIDDRHGEGGRLVCQEATIICALQVELQICSRDMRADSRGEHSRSGNLLQHLNVTLLLFPSL